MAQHADEPRRDDRSRDRLADEHRPPGPGDAERHGQRHREADDHDAPQPLDQGQLPGPALRAQRSDVELDQCARQRRHSKELKQRGGGSGVVRPEDPERGVGQHDRRGDDRQQDLHDATERGPRVVTQPVDVERALDGQRDGHVDGEQVDHPADDPGDVEVRRGGRPDLCRHDHRNEVDDAEREQGADVVTGEEAADIPDRRGDVPVFGGPHVPRSEPTEDQEVDRHDRRGDGDDPREEDAGAGGCGGEADHQGDLGDAEHDVLDRNPDRTPQRGQDCVLQREDPPRDHRDREPEARCRTVQARVRRSPVLEGEQEPDARGTGDERARQVRPEDEGACCGAGPRQEAADHAGQAHCGEPREQHHRRDRRGAPAHVGGVVVARRQDPVDDAECAGRTGVEHQRVGVPEERIGEMPLRACGDAVHERATLPDRCGDAAHRMLTPAQGPG